MKSAWKTYFTKPQTTIAVVVALMAQLIFCIVWMTAYNGVLDRVDKLQIAVVNEDGPFGEQLEQQLQNNLPFQISAVPKEQALQQLEKRQVHMVITIPAGFGESLSAPETTAKLSYVMNASNPQLAANVMQSAVTKITGELNHRQKVDSSVQVLHPVDGMNNQMVPMMLVLASYVGAMLMAMNVHQAADAIGGSLSRWQHFAVRTGLIVFAAALISIVGSGLIVLLGGQMQSSFFIFWLFHFLTMATFMFFAQLFLMVFGMAGMFFNMAALSLQLVTSGTIVPKQMLSGFYQHLGQFLPATYAVEGFMNLQFGGIQTEKDVWTLLALIMCCITVTFAVTLLKGRAQPVKSMAAAA
ncbi:YhgE/Pip domain-containing protein [Paenibacillus thermotolerans]|uniref:YhgE/Pip domain-containing protein n=1 Tax=Paenibacillus thermotolerans TaxID=3027807 RepID=UPI0023675A65|nr:MULTISPECIES: ABC transporter permease [unclassified Paenibacillus]